MPPLRLLFPIVCVLGACAPAAAPETWQKAGAAGETVAADTAQCQSISGQQATRLYPYGGTAPGMGGAGSISAQQQSNIDRDSAQRQMFNECMEGKGYARSPR